MKKLVVFLMMVLLSFLPTMVDASVCCGDNQTQNQSQNQSQNQTAISNSSSAFVRPSCCCDFHYVLLSFL